MRFVSVAAFLAVSALAVPAAAANLVANGDFEAGLSGFASNYTAVDPALTNGGSMYPEGAYTVGNNAISYHNLWASVAGQGGAGRYLIVNGATSPTLLWEQTVGGVAAGSSYFFEAFAANICCNANYGGANTPSTITFQAVQNNVVTTLNTFTTSTTAGLWQGFSNSYTALTNAPVTLRLINASTEFGGNDFGVDTISFSQTSILGGVPEPASWAMLLAGFGLVGMISRRRGIAVVAS
jgi:hypothetical protein